MTDAEIIKALGGPRRVAALLKAAGRPCRPQLVSGWKRRGISRERRADVAALAKAAGLPLDVEAFLGLPAGLLAPRGAPAVTMAAA